MLRESRSSGRSVGLALSVLLGALIAAGCGGGGDHRKDPSKRNSEEIDPELVAANVKFIHEYAAALLKLGSKDPNDWVDAKHKLEAFPPGYHVFTDDLPLIDQLRHGKPSEVDVARKELARRGWLLDRLLVFTLEHSQAEWDAAAKDLIANGEAARGHLTKTLILSLVNEFLRDRWTQIRALMVRVGDIAFETTVSVVKQRADECPPGLRLKTDDMVQLIMVLIAFGEKGRPVVRELAKHPNWNVRKFVSLAVAESIDVSLSDLLVGYLDDPEWQVRWVAAECIGRLGPAREKTGPAVIAAIEREKDKEVRPTMIKALGEMHYLPAIPLLMRLMELPSAKESKAAMYSMYRITGEKINTGPEWSLWYREKYPEWIKRQK